MTDKRLTLVGSIDRQVAKERIRGYSIDLYHQGKAVVTTSPSSKEGLVRTFDVFEAAES